MRIARFLPIFVVPVLVCALFAQAEGPPKDYEIKLTRPPKVGQKYKLNAEGAALDQKQTRSHDSKKLSDTDVGFGVRLEGTCEILEVNRDGEEGKVACTITKCVLITEEGESELVPAGRVITAKGGKEDTTFTIDKGKLSPEANEALDLVLRMGEDDGYNDDMIYGTKARQPVGGTWPVDQKVASKEAADDDVKFDPKDISGALKLEKLETVDGVECEHITGQTEIKSFVAKAPNDMKFVKGSLKARYSGLYPLDTSVGTLAESMSVTNNATYQTEKADDDGPAGTIIESKLQRASEMKRTFLPFK